MSISLDLIGAAGGTSATTAFTEQTIVTSLFSSSDTPAVLSSSDASEVNLGVRFEASTVGAIWGVKYYKGDGDTGTHVGSLWSSDGTLLASATFTNETSTGWQSVLFSEPVSITAGTTYVASYHSNGHYSYTSNYFTTAHTDGLLTAFAVDNGVFTYSDGNAFPTSSFNATNYWVDVLFSSNGAPNQPPVANDDAATVAEGGAVTTLSVLANDSDTDSTLTPASITGFSQGAHGSIVYNNDGTFTYTHDGSETAADSFSYTIDDGAGGTTTATVNVTITPVNDAAVLSADVSNLTETNAAGDISTAGTLTISDVDSPASFVAQAGTAGSYGTFAIDSAGAWTYTANSEHNEFEDGTTYTDTFSVASTDGTLTSVAINILGTNDAAVLSADVSNLTETNAAGDISTAGTLTISDVDSPASFVAQAGTAGSYGTFAIDSAGAWTYTANSEHNEFEDGTTYTDTFSVASTDGTLTSVAINILGTNDAAVLSADVSNLTETNAAGDISTAGTLTISDVDSPASFVAQAGTAGSYGTFAIDSAGAWTYTANSEHNEFEDGTTYTDTFSVASTDGTLTSVAINILGTNDAAVLSADVSNLTETNAAGDISTAGTLTISDVDSPASFVAQAGTAGSYGTFAIDSAGAWTYTANSEHTEFEDGTTYTDTFSVASTDGTLTSVAINILGTNDAAVLSADVSNLTETNAAGDISTAGTLTISDVDSPASFVAQAGTAGSYGTFAIDSAGAWTYTANSEHNEFEDGTTYTDTFSVASTDGTLTSVAINILGTNDAAVLSADVSNLTETNAAGDISTAGTLTISDVDSPASFVAQAGTAGSYGTFAIDSAGAWTYTANSEHNEFEDGTTYTDTFSVASTDGTLTSVAINILGTNDAAVVASDSGGDTAAVSIAENNTAVTTVTAIDPDAGQTLSYSIVGGADAAKFTIGSSTGALSLVTAPNFEAPTDAGSNNVYDVAVQVSDGHGGIDTQVIAVTVQNVIGVTINGNAGNDLIDATHTVAGQPLPTNEEDVINGGSGQDIINGLGGNDMLNGGANSDTMTGGAGDDTYVVDSASDVVTESAGEGTDTIQSSVPYTLSANVENLSLTGSGNINGNGNPLDNAITGNSGNNVLEGGAGADHLDGGAGTDTASYAGSGTGVNASLMTGTGSGGDALGDTFLNIENLTGSNFDDVLEGNGGNNVLSGGANGLGGDTASYANATAGVTVSLTTLAQNTVGAGIDTLLGFENLTGSAFGDKLTGSSLGNLLAGGAGNDVINGGAGNDTLQGGADDDILIGGAGADALDGGGGNDTASYAGSAVAVTVALNAGTGLGGDAQDDTLTDIENLIGSAFNDTLTGDGNDNELTGGAGNDILAGGLNGAGGDTASYATATAGVTVSLLLQGGAQNTVGAGVDTLSGIENLIGSAFNDTLTGDAGNNVLTGGAGNDTASYATAGSGVTVNLALAGPQDTAGAGVDTLIGIERLIGSASNDMLMGDGLANLINGGAGDDTIDGRAGNDILIGGANSAAGDTLSYASSAAGVTVSLAIQDGVTAQNTLGAGTHTLSGFENLTGSDFNDTLTGSSLANVLVGGAGNDVINGGAGNDTVQGGADDDVLIGGAGPDALDGGAGSDTASYASSTAAVTVDLNAGTGLGGDAQGDTLTDIENLIGSAFNDTLTGDGNDNVLTGGAGKDTLAGGLNGAAGDTASYATATAGVTLSLLLQGGAQNTVGAGTDTLSGIENLIGSALNDTLTGDGNNNVLTGGAGNDMLLGGAGDDTLDGGAGTADTASYATAGSGVTVNLALAGPQDTVGAGVDALIGIERLIGSASNDTLTGDGLANRIDGGAGDDTIDDRAGNDILLGGANTAAGDTVSYASATAGVTVSLGIQDGVTAQNTLGAGTDTLSGFENLTGSAFNDTLTGSGLANVIMGGAGNDIINGGAGNDNLQGGAGTDTLKGGAGNDTLTGGMDADSFVFDSVLNALTNVDDVTDFQLGVDHIGLENSIFTKLVATGALSADFFHVGTAAADANDFIIYDDATGALYYDSNGSAAGQQVQFAHLDPGLALTHTDFFVV